MKKASSICFCGLFCALFFALSNLVPALRIFGNVPLTAQVFVVALMSFLLDYKFSVLTYVTILVMTLCGLPMMSGLSSGIYALIGPTAGYIAGWFLLISMIATGKKTAKKVRKEGTKILIVMLFSVIGLLLVYLTGAIWLAAYSDFNIGLVGVINLFASNISTFLLLDIIKVIAGYAVFKFLKKFI